MMLNVIVYQFAKNFSNINLPGYLFVRRKVSMSRGGDEDLIKTRAKNMFLILYFFIIIYMIIIKI